MKREDKRELFRILQIRVRETQERVHNLGLCNTAGLSPIERADLDADYALAQSDLFRAARELNEAIARESY